MRTRFRRISIRAASIHVYFLNPSIPATLNQTHLQQFRVAAQVVLLSLHNSNLWRFLFINKRASVFSTKISKVWWRWWRQHNNTQFMLVPCCSVSTVVITQIAVVIDAVWRMAGLWVLEFFSKLQIPHTSVVLVRVPLGAKTSIWLITASGCIGLHRAASDR